MTVFADPIVGYMPQVLPPSTLVSVSPSLIPAGSGNTAITITGTNFSAGTPTIRVNGVSLATTGYTNSTTLTATILAASLAAATTLAITVDKSVGSASIIVQNPTISSLNPASIASGAGNTNITITGTLFVTGVSVAYSGATALTTVVNSGTSITATLTSAMLASPTTLSISVTNGAAGSNNMAFTVTTGGNNPIPVITSLTPDNVIGSETNPSIAIAGTGFISTSTAYLNGVALTTTYTSGTAISAVIPTATCSAIKSDISEMTVVNGTPGGGTSNRAYIRGLGTTSLAHSQSYTLPNKLVYDVKAYGALGDGAHNDVAAIRSALTAAISASGGIVYFPAGTYAVSPALSDQNVDLSDGALCFNLPTGSSNIAFVGARPSSIPSQGAPTLTSLIKGYYPGMLNPKTNWNCNGNAGDYFHVGRFHMFGCFTSPNNVTFNVSNLIWKNLELDGGAGWTGVYTGGCEAHDYTYDSATTGSPAASHFQFNNANPASASIAYIDNSNTSGQAMLQSVASGGTLSFYDKSTNTQYQAQISGGTLASNRWTFTISSIVLAKGTALTAGGLGTISNGDGWDLGHKCFYFGGNGQMDQVNLIQCHFHNWRGEIVFISPGTTTAAWLNIVNVTTDNSNATGINPGGPMGLLYDKCINGGPGANQIYNCFEHTTSVGVTQTVYVQNSLLQYAALNGGNFGANSTWTWSFTGNTVQYINHGVQLVDGIQNFTASGNTFTNCSWCYILTSGSGTGITGGFHTLSFGSVSGPETFDGRYLSTQNLGSSGIAVSYVAGNGNRLGAGGFDYLLADPFSVSGTFTVDHCNIVNGTRDTDNAGGQVAIWTNTTYGTADECVGNKVDIYSGSPPFPIRPNAAEIFLNSVNTGATAPFLAYIPDLTVFRNGYTCLFRCPYNPNWKLKSDATWNTWGADIAVVDGVTKIQFNGTKFIQLA